MGERIGRCYWEPLPMEYLAAARDQARAAGDAEMLALVREISRLHYVLLKTHQTIDFVRTEPGEQTLRKVQELRSILDKEPLIIKRKSIWTGRLASPGEPPGKRTQDFDG